MPHTVLLTSGTPTLTYSFAPPRAAVHTRPDPRRPPARLQLCSVALRPSACHLCSPSTMRDGTWHESLKNVSSTSVREFLSARLTCRRVMRGRNLAGAGYAKIFRTTLRWPARLAAQPHYSSRCQMHDQHYVLKLYRRPNRTYSYTQRLLNCPCTCRMDGKWSRVR